MPLLLDQESTIGSVSLAGCYVRWPNVGQETNRLDTYEQSLNGVTAVQSFTVQKSPTFIIEWCPREKYDDLYELWQAGGEQDFVIYSPRDGETAREFVGELLSVTYPDDEDEWEIGDPARDVTIRVCKKQEAA